MNEELKSKIEAINKEVDGIYIDPDGKSRSIYDGVVNLKQYLSSKLKILWILKEPWDEDDGTGGGWSVVKDILGVENVYESIGRSPTFQPMVYVAFSILNGFLKWEEMNYIRDDPEIANILHCIAYINIKKLPGFHCANDELIYLWYEKAKALLWKQIKTFSPDVVIGCRPHMSYIMQDAGIQSSSTYGSLTYGVVGSRLYIDAYHPSQRTITRETYVNELIELVRLQNESRIHSALEHIQ